MQYFARNGWTIQFRRNIHMYCHALTASKNDRVLQIPCEDTPDGYISVWAYDLEISESEFRELLVAIREWAETTEIRYRLYVTRDDFEDRTQAGEAKDSEG